MKLPDAIIAVLPFAISMAAAVALAIYGHPVWAAYFGAIALATAPRWR